MKRNHKIILAIVLTACGLALIGWNLRDPDAAYREQPTVEAVVTIQQVPPAVKATIERLTKAGGTIEDIQEERSGDEVKYELDVIHGNTKTEYEILPDGSIGEQKSKKIKP